MKNSGLILAAFTMNVGFLCHEVEADAVSEKLYEKLDPLVVTVQILDENHKGLGHGTGFIFDDFYVEGQWWSTVVTNFHVVTATQEERTKWTKYSYEIIDNKGKKIAESQETYSDPRHDLALIILRGHRLKYERIGTGFGFIVLAPELVKTGQDIIMIGSPKGYRNTLSEGQISNVPEAGGDFVQDQIYQINAPGSPGSSGSPVFLKVLDEGPPRIIAGYGDQKELAESFAEGQKVEAWLVGVQESIDEKGQYLNFIVPGAYVDLLQRALDERFLGKFPDSLALSVPFGSDPAAITKQYEYHNGGQ